MKRLFCLKLGNGGRLGNQLFTIASTIGIALRNGMMPQFPANWKYRDEFNLPDDFFTDSTPIDPVFYLEPGFEYHDVQIVPNRDGVVTGYRQSYKYWQGYEKQIRQWLMPKDVQPGGLDAVCLHYRRGDYVGNPNYHQLKETYYLNGYLAHNVGHLNAFSDDRHFANGLHAGTYTDPVTEMQDFRHMVSHAFHVCSNSTFSWWCAYLSGGVVIRPEKYFAGALSVNSTDDFWPQQWHVVGEQPSQIMATFVIPVSFDHPDRLANMDGVLRYLKAHFSCEIIVGEIDTHRFNDVCKAHGVKHVHYSYGFFHRTRAINEMTKLAANDIVFNYDADVFLSPWQILEAYELLTIGAGDICYPYDGTFFWCPRKVLDGINKHGTVGPLGGIKFPRAGATPKDPNSYGGVVGYSRNAFFEAGGENENLRSYAPEDQERWMRFNKLGLNVSRVDGPLYHIDHYRGINSGEKHPHAVQNRQYYERLMRMTLEELQAEIKSWIWAKS